MREDQLVPMFYMKLQLKSSNMLILMLDMCMNLFVVPVLFPALNDLKSFATGRKFKKIWY